MTIEQHKDFLVDFRAQQIELNQQISDAGAKLEAMLSALRALDIETKKATGLYLAQRDAFNKGANQ